MAGRANAVLIMGSENTSSIRYFKGRDDQPDHSEAIDGQLEDRGYGYDGIFDEYTIRHGLIGAPVQYGLLENARRARLGLSVQDYRQAMGSCSPRCRKSLPRTLIRRRRWNVPSTSW